VRAFALAHRRAARVTAVFAERAARTVGSHVPIPCSTLGVLDLLDEL